MRQILPERSFLCNVVSQTRPSENYERTNWGAREMSTDDYDANTNTSTSAVTARLQYTPATRAHASQTFFRRPDVPGF